MSDDFVVLLLLSISVCTVLAHNVWPLQYCRSSELPLSKTLILTSTRTGQYPGRSSPFLSSSVPTLSIPTTSLPSRPLTVFVTLENSCRTWNSLLPLRRCCSIPKRPWFQLPPAFVFLPFPPFLLVQGSTFLGRFVAPEYVNMCVLGFVWMCKCLYV